MRIFCLRLSSHFAQAPWWTLLCLAALAALAVLLYSLGRAKGRIKEKSGFTAACMLGAPLAAPAKLVFKALGSRPSPT